MRTSSPAQERSALPWLAVLLLVVIAFRAISLGADPMPELDWGFISDSGTWWKNPRLHAVWGVWMVDDGNYGILTAPSYTVVMRAMFALFGVGYAQAYTASAVSGVLTVVLTYGLVRREGGATAGLLAAGLVGLNALTIAYDRSAYPESFQLMMMTAAVACVLGSGRRRWLAPLGGLAAVVVLLAKPPGLVLAPVAALTWIAPWIMDRRDRVDPPRFSMRAMIAYVVAAAALLAVVGVVYFRPHASDVLLHFRSQMAGAAALGGAATERVPLFGTRLGYRLNGFFKQEWYLLLVVAAFGAARIARVMRLRVTTVEVACWVWLLAGIGIMGLQTYQQDRRFLFVIPPLAILSAIAFASAIELGESAWDTPRARRVSAGVAAGVLAIVVMFYVVPLAVWKTIKAAALVGLTLSYGASGGLIVSLTALAVALLVAWRAPRMHWRGNTRMQIALAVLPMVFIFGRSGYELLHRSRGLENVSRTLDSISERWPQSERVAAGWPAGTLTLGSRVVPVNHELKGLSAAERFHPQLELYASTPGRPTVQGKIWQVPGRPQKVDCAQMPAWDDAPGKPRLVVHIFVEPDRLEACRASVRAAGVAAQ